MSFPAAPADPQIVTTHALVGSLQSLVFCDGGTDLPRNLCTNSLARTWAGTNATNFGPAPIWRPTDFTPDATPSACLRFASNSRALAYPGSGITTSLVRDTNVLDLTYFAIFAVDAVDASGSPNGMMVPISSNGQGVYGGYGTDSAVEDGLAIYLPGGGSGSASAYMVWNWKGATLRNYDSTGTTLLCPILPGHWYFGAVSVGGAYGAGGCHFYLYDLTAGAQVSPTGPQTFSDGADGNYTDARYNNWIPGSAYGNYAEHTICSAGGAVVRVRMAGLDNRMWTDAIGNAWVANPYAMLTATRVTGGSPPASLISTALGSGTYDGGPLTAPGATTTGAFPTKVVYLGDAVISRVTEASITVAASAPLGASPITAWKLYGGTSASISLTGTPLATATTPTLPYTPPDAGLRFYQATATTAGGTVYVYPILEATLRSRAPVTIIKAGNSINTITGAVSWAFHGAGAGANEAGFDLTLSTQGVEGQYGTEWINETNSHNFYGPKTPGGAVITCPLDFLLARAAQELAATGKPVDAVSLQLAGNSSNITTAQYSQICASILAGTGQQANYTVAVTAVHLAAPPLQVAGHSAAENLALITTATANSQTAAAANPTKIKVTGLNAQAASIAYPSSSTGGHPDPFIAMIEGADDIAPFLPGATPAPATVAPAAADVRKNVTYTVAGATVTGLFDPVTGNYTDPGAANVLTGHSYVFASVTIPGAYTPPTSSGGSGDPAAALAAIGLTSAVVTQIVANLDAKVSTRSTFAAPVGFATTIGTLGTLVVTNGRVSINLSDLVPMADQSAVTSAPTVGACLNAAWVDAAGDKSRTSNNDGTITEVNKNADGTTFRNFTYTATATSGARV